VGRSTKNEGLWENQPKEWENRWGDFPARHLLTPEVHGSSAFRGKGTSWMGSFLNACQNCRIDAIAIHSYWCTLAPWWMWERFAVWSYGSIMFHPQHDK